MGTIWLNHEPSARADVRTDLNEAAAAAVRAQHWWYLRTGQWRADAQTFAAAVRFVLDTGEDYL